MADSDLDRSQAATPHKLQQARGRGQVAKSADVISTVVFTSAMLFLSWQGWPVWQKQFGLDQALLLQAGHLDLNIETMWSLIDHLLRSTMFLAAPFLGVLVLAAVVGNMLQTGPMLSTDPISPDWDRLNPVQGLKKVFSLRTLFVAGRAMVKLLLLTLVGFFALKSLLPHFYRLAALTPLGYVHELLDDFSSLGLKLAGMLALVALIDLMYSRYEFAKKMRMSRREMKDEVRNREGDPRIRARMRELRKEMLKRSLSLRKTRDADVLITNPTHVAVALRYVHGEMNSPQLICKGRGIMALAMRKIAGRHGIPVVHSPTLARTLYRDLAIDHYVQPELYARVARIIVWVFAQRDAKRRSSSAARPRTASKVPTIVSSGGSSAWAR